MVTFKVDFCPDLNFDVLKLKSVNEDGELLFQRIKLKYSDVLVVGKNHTQGMYKVNAIDIDPSIYPEVFDALFTGHQPVMTIKENQFVLCSTKRRLMITFPLFQVVKIEGSVLFFKTGGELDLRDYIQEDHQIKAALNLLVEALMS